MRFFKIENEANVAVLVLNRPDKEMNVLSEEVLLELNECLDKVVESKAEGMVIISGKPEHFIVGADIKEIEKLKTAEAAAEGAAKMQALFSKIAKLPFPTVAAINGSCLGGGTELSLACTWRVLTEQPSTHMALPEIQLGLIPGAGGTQRLPRLIGLQTALDMILTGKKLNGKRALKAGLADACVPASLLREEAIKLAKKKRSNKGHSGGFFSSGFAELALEGNIIGRKIMRKKATEMTEKKTKGFYPAAYKAIEAVFDGYETSIDNGLKLEARLFGELAMTRESKSLIHLFHATTAIKKHPFKDADKEMFADRPVELVGVIGAGFMGAGIANVCAEKNIRVRLSDPNAGAIGRAMKSVYDYFRKKVERKRLKSFELSQKLNRVSPGLKPIGMKDCDVVIEAVFEDLNLKQSILKQVEKNAPDNWIFASNTSAIPIGEIAAASTKPERVVGMHFFSPVEKMPLLEVIATSKTAPWVTARVVELGRRIGKQVIVVKDSPGFYTTRALAFYLAEASLLMTEGVQIEAIDNALTDFGYPVGPITLIDEVGIDVGIHVLRTMEKAFPDRIASPPGLKAVEDSGRLGRKNGKGFYTYQNGKKGLVDKAVYDLLGKDAPKSAKVPTEDIVDRCNLAFVNETVRCLEEGILPTAYEGDVGAVFGLGFPPFLGGPLRYIDHIGAKNIYEKLVYFTEKYGKRFQPCNKLISYAKENKRFFPDEA